MQLPVDEHWTPDQRVFAQTIAVQSGRKAMGRGSEVPEAIRATADWIELIYGDDIPFSALVALGIAAAEQYKLEKK